MTSIPCVLALSFPEQAGKHPDQIMALFIQMVILPLAPAVEAEGGTMLLALAPVDVPVLCIYDPVLATAIKLMLSHSGTAYKIEDHTKPPPLDESYIAEMRDHGTAEESDAWQRYNEPSLN